MPVGDVLVGNAGGDIKHDDTALAVDVVTVTETTELLLTGGIPNVELDLAEVLGHGLAPRTGPTWGCRQRLTVVKPRG